MRTLLCVCPLDAIKASPPIFCDISQLFKHHCHSEEVMSYDSSGFRMIELEVDVIAWEVAREKQARKRFEDRIEEKRSRKDRLEREAQEPVRRREAIEREIEQQNQQLATLEESLADHRRRKRLKEDELETLKNKARDVDH